MLPVVLGLSAGISWGIADFFGGLASRRGRVAACVAAAQLAGLLLLGAVLAARRTGPPPADGIVLGLAAGAFSALGLVAFYRGLAVGAMSLVAPVASVGAVVPLASGLASGERPSPLAGIGVAAALAGTVLVARARGPLAPRGLGLALLAAAGFGGFLAIIAPAAETDQVWAVTASRVTAVPLVAGAALASGGALTVTRGQLPLVLAAGVLDSLANLLYAVGTQRGLVSLVAVLASLYPVATVVLARTVLGERVTGAQGAGIALALGGVALIAAG